MHQVVPMPTAFGKRPPTLEDELLLSGVDKADLAEGRERRGSETKDLLGEADVEEVNLRPLPSSSSLVGSASKTSAAGKEARDAASGMGGAPLHDNRNDEKLSLIVAGGTSDGVQDDGKAEGQLQAGEMATPWKWDYFGVYFQYVVVGVYYGSMQPLMYPIFKNLLGMPSYAVKGGYQVMTLWWSLKIFIGALSDSVPLCGFRRKSYVLTGWIVALGLTIVTMLLGQPQKGDAAWPWLLCFSAINFAYIFADVAMDGMVTDLAQREPEAKRGSLQSNVYMIRTVVMGVVAVFMSFGFSSEEYGGEFDWGFTLPSYLIFMTAVAALSIYPFFRMKESRTSERKSYCVQFRALFKRVQLHAVWRVIVFSFVVHFFAYISNAASYDVEVQWCKTKPWVDGLFSNVLAHILMAGGIFLTKKYLLNVNWRKTLFWALIFMALGGFVPSIFIDLGILRSQFFFVGAPLINQVTVGIFFIVSSFCAVEVAEPGSEGITYALLTTVGNLTIPFTSLISANLATLFHLYDPENPSQLLDTDDARKRMLMLDFTIMMLNLCALPSLLILPSQKKEIQSLLASGRSSFAAGVIITIVLVFCLLWSSMGSFMQIFESTSCLRFVGGRGC